MNSLKLSITDCTKWHNEGPDVPLVQADKYTEMITRIELGSIGNPLPLTFASSSTANSALISQTDDLKLALSAKLKRVSVLLSASDAHSINVLQQNRMKRLRHLDKLCEQAREHQIAVRCYIMCAFSCPIEGRTSPHELAEICAKLIRFGCEDVIFVDNEGTGNSKDLMAMFSVLSPQLPKARTGFYFSADNPETPSMIKIARNNGIIKFCASRNTTLITGSQTKTSLNMSDLPIDGNL